MIKDKCIQLLLNSGHSEFDRNKYCKTGNYTLRHGEYERPTYRIVKHRGQNDYYIKVKYYYYNGTMNAPQSGPLSCEEVESLKIIAHERSREL